MNAVWGTRLPEEEGDAEKSGCLPTKIHYPALAIWGKIIVDLHNKCPFKQLVLAGSWARFLTQYETDRRVSGSIYFKNGREGFLKVESATIKKRKAGQSLKSWRR
jgi:hypothetical protein